MSGLSAQNVEEPSLATVLARAGEYVLHFERDLSNVVAEERYTQDVRRGVLVRVHRDLKSDLLVVRLDDGYVQFRDVFEVDGRPVRNRNDRLQKLFLQPSKSSIDEARRIMTESARYERRRNRPKHQPPNPLVDVFGARQPVALQVFAVHRRRGRAIEGPATIGELQDLHRAVGRRVP